jgi:hypothetical protein
MYEYICVSDGIFQQTHFFHVRRQHLVLNMHFRFHLVLLHKKIKIYTENMKIHPIMAKLLYAYRQLQLAFFYRLQNKSKSNTNVHFQHLPVKAPSSYKTVLCCSLASGLTLLSTNNFPTCYIALLFYLTNIGWHFKLECFSN